jgi:hypothetical protein
MQRHGQSPIDPAAHGRSGSLAYHLGGPRFVHRDAHYLSIPVVCRRDTAALLTGVALRHARDWLQRHDIDPATPDLLQDGIARIVDLEWPLPFRNGNPDSAQIGRVTFGWRYLVEFGAGDMLTAAVRWGRLGGGRLVPLADLR